MIEIYYCYIDTKHHQAYLQTYAEMMPLDVRDKLAKFRQAEDVQRHLCGRLLLLEALKKKGYDQTILSAIRYTEWHKPYLELPGIDFSISHSGQLVCCAVNWHGSVGIDVEQIKKVDLSEFKNVFSPQEWRSIEVAGDTQICFYEYWAKKEAVIKADGRGWNIKPTDILLDNNIAELEGNYWHLKNLEQFDGYAALLASKNEVVSVSWHAVDFGAGQ